jgi:hypothetical protein
LKEVVGVGPFEARTGVRQAGGRPRAPTVDVIGSMGPVGPVAVHELAASHPVEDFVLSCRGTLGPGSKTEYRPSPIFLHQTF